jgi:hypothetical protein
VAQGAIALFPKGNCPSPSSQARPAQRSLRCSLTVISSIRLKDVAVAGEQIHQFRVDEQLFLADRLLAQHVDRHERLEVSGRRLTMSLAATRQADMSLFLKNGDMTNRAISETLIPRSVPDVAGQCVSFSG